MASVVAFPRLPTPPGEINSVYIADLVRALEFFMLLVQNPGESRSTTQVLTNAQAGNDVGLEAGTFYIVDSYVRITLLNVSACAGSTGTGQIGTVTVAVS